MVPLAWALQAPKLTNSLKPGFASLLSPILEEYYEQRNKIFQHMADLLEHSPVEDLVLFPRFGADPSAFSIMRKALLNSIACVLKVLEFDACLSTPDGVAGSCWSLIVTIGQEKDSFCLVVGVRLWSMDSQLGPRGPPPGDSTFRSHFFPDPPC